MQLFPFLECESQAFSSFTGIYPVVSLVFLLVVVVGF
jgi:hypothetical protein